MTGDVTINLDADTAAVLLDWLQHEDAIDEFKWAAARPGDRVALKQVLAALSANATSASAAGDARRRLEATLPQEPEELPEELLRNAPEDIRRQLLSPLPDTDIASRVANRLDMLGAPHTGVTWRARRGTAVEIEVGLDPYSEDIERRIRLMSEPIEVRIVRGPRRPRWRPESDDRDE